MALLAVLLLGISCRPSAAVPLAKPPRIASVTPAGSDLIVGIGATDHLVGVSNYDTLRPGTEKLPRIGDYNGIDWEKLAPLQPQILVTQYGSDRYPPGLQGRCRSMGIEIVNIKIDRLADIYRETSRIAGALGEKEKGQKAIAALQAQLDSIKARVASQPPVKAIVVTSETTLDLAGPGEFLDELLTIAGGENAAARLNHPYPSVDREQLGAMAPQVVIQLIPDADRTPQVLTASRQFWSTMADLPAVKNRRVFFISDPFSLQPGLQVGDLARQFADVLHSDPGTRP